MLISIFCLSKTLEILQRCAHAQHTRRTQTGRQTHTLFHNKDQIPHTTPNEYDKCPAKYSSNDNSYYSNLYNMHMIYKKWALGRPLAILWDIWSLLEHFTHTHINRKVHILTHTDTITGNDLSQHTNPNQSHKLLA